MRTAILTSLILTATCFINAQLTAVDILKKSIATHDPKKRWHALKAQFDISIVREKQADRFFTIHLNLPKKIFQYAVKYDSLHYSQGFKGEKFEVR